MLETMLEYAGERLQTDFDRDPTHQRMAEFFLAFAEEAEPHLTTGGAGDLAGPVARARPPTSGARSSGPPRRDKPISASRPPPPSGGSGSSGVPRWEGRRALDRLLTLPASSSAIRAKALGAASALAWWDGDALATRRYAEEALPLAQKGGNRQAEIEALYNLAFPLLWSGLPDGGMEVDRAEELFLPRARAPGGGCRTTRRRTSARRSCARGSEWSPASRGATSPRHSPCSSGRSSCWRKLATDRKRSRRSWSLGTLTDLPAIRQAPRGYTCGPSTLCTRPATDPYTGLLFILTALEGDTGRHERVATIWGAAAAAQEASGALKPPGAVRLIGDPVATARETMGDEAVERALAAGQRWTPTR